jgi:phosphoglycerate dehydrogenase-like enzyme
MILVTLPYFPPEWLKWNWPDHLHIINKEREPYCNVLDKRAVRVWITDPASQHNQLIPASIGYKNMELVVTASTGDNHINREALERHGVEFRSLLDRRADLNEIKGSSEFALFLILAALRNARNAFDEAERWDQHHYMLRGNELYRKKVGIIGLGRIGQNLYRYLMPFRVKVLTNEVGDQPHSKKFIFENCDVVVICCTLDDQTRGMITEELLESMPRGAVLVNVARGEIIDEDALYRVLVKRPDLRAAVDVLSGEVSGAHLSSPLLKMNNMIVTPHVAGLTYEANEKAAKIVLDIVREWYGN